jgi:hypothetical protein
VELVDRQTGLLTEEGLQDTKPGFCRTSSLPRRKNGTLVPRGVSRSYLSQAADSLSAIGTHVRIEGTARRVGGSQHGPSDGRDSGRSRSRWKCLGGRRTERPVADARTGYAELKLGINRSLTAFCVPEIRKNEDVGHRTGGPGDHAACPKLPALSRQPQRETTTVPKSRPRPCVPKPPAGARPADLDDSVAAAERKSRRDTCQRQGSIKQFTCRCPSCQDVDISSKRGLAHS